MKNAPALKPRKGDLLAVGLVLLLAVGLTAALGLRARSASRVHAEIYLDGVLVREVTLDGNQSFTLSGDYTNTVTVEDGKIAVTSSTCPGSDCVHSGWIHRAGQTIVCLPNRAEIRLVGAAGSDGVDAVAG